MTNTLLYEVLINLNIESKEFVLMIRPFFKSESISSVTLKLRAYKYVTKVHSGKLCSQQAKRIKIIKQVDMRNYNFFWSLKQSFKTVKKCERYSSTMRQKKSDLLFLNCTFYL